MRPIHPDFDELLSFKEQSLIELYRDLRAFVLELHPDSNELLYHTHALTSVYSLSEKLGDAYCMIPIYTNHLNLGFNKGTLLKDPHKLLNGTGNLIRHIPVQKTGDYRNKKVKDLMKEAVDLAMKDMIKPGKMKAGTVSKIGKR